MLPALLLLAAPFASAASITRRDDHHDLSYKPLPGNWYHPDDHPAHKLFKRGPTDDGVEYAPVGSATWSSAYPASSPDVSKLPQPWVDALNAAIAAGKIPTLPQSSNTPQTNPVYPQGTDPMKPEVCSATYKCKIPGDIWDAPAGYFGTGFDDGPTPASNKLYQFLQANNERATHFMIGTNILNNPNQFIEAFETNQDDIAVHTWTHPYMTTLSNMQILGQLGWTMEIIHNSTGGRLPRYWRPPYGDYDMRVRAIAREVFGLEVIIWNQDTADWSLTTGGTTATKINASMTQWLTGPKTPGLIVLEHELSDQSVQAFIDAYPNIKSYGWKMMSTAELAGKSPYQNSASSTAPVTPAGVLAGGANSSIPIGTSTSAASSSTQVPGSTTATSAQSNTTSSSSGVAVRVTSSAVWTLLKTTAFSCLVLLA